ncbi:hypothetical protein CONPUDRAFT_149411 [Coniophora puteana RWD-64-598 SS2]|uniref:Uncharacterized protein n=1 Tax=Coniophora puteana (strain RWD-64-598) TaxID=741705 RepID=A0A5M3N7G0_CONPW|nr:uncharacterized protein CONPUDRAFT_149411 [Coniophora puteana RWD-64-598 SS2]EIW87379.1 hypothetical protein CONPUDRAFT_149411 [Coniophora puteana RWD-64-598 SS2]
MTIGPGGPYQIQIPLPPKIDASVTMMQVGEKPDVTYSDVGGCTEQIEKLPEMVETPLLSLQRFVKLGIDPPKGVLLFGPPIGHMQGPSAAYPICHRHSWVGQRPPRNVLE